MVLDAREVRDIARHLIETGAIPGLRGFDLIHSEVTRGDHRFDSLLQNGKRELILDVIPCPHSSERIAAYPPEPAPKSERSHLEELAGLNSGQPQAALLFISDNTKAEAFIPDYHTDLKYTQTLLELKAKRKVMALAYRNKDHSVDRSRVRMLEIPWDLIRGEAKDRGSYMVVLRLPRCRGKCRSHLFYFPGDPLTDPDFQRLVQYYRMERLVERCRG